MRILSVDPGRKNLGMCVLDIDETERNGTMDTILFWNLAETPTEVGGLRSTLDTLLCDVAYDEVVIERQPPKNPAMKRFEHLFEMYFAMHDKPVYVIDSRHKLTFAAKTPFWTGGDVTGGKGSWSYIKRKKISVGIVTKFLEATKQRNEHFHSMFGRAQKKDDFSDSLLQAQAFAHVVKHIDAEKARADKIIKPRPFPKPRAPKPSAGKPDRLTKANIAYFLQACTTIDDINKELADKKKIRHALTTLFGSPETFLASRIVYTERNERKRGHLKSMDGIANDKDKICLSPTPQSTG